MLGNYHILPKNYTILSLLTCKSDYNIDCTQNLMSNPIILVTLHTGILSKQFKKYAISHETTFP